MARKKRVATPAKNNLTEVPKREKKNIFQQRLMKHYDELRWLYTELYHNDDMFGELCQQLEWFYNERNEALKKRDISRENEPDWFKKSDMLGMMLYIDNFAGTINGVKEKLSYLQDCQVNCVHLMPFLDTVDERSDGGYAVADFRKVKPSLGTMDDLAGFTQECHKRDMNVCMDFVMNHTSVDHEWAQRAKTGDGEYMSRYFFYSNDEIPKKYEETVPQVFPTTAPGNFTWIPEVGHFVLTTFYPYQWDLNYKNPRVFNEMMYNFLFLANKGIDIVRIDAVPYIWKELGTNCRNLPQVHTIVRMMRMIGEIVCPSVVLLGEVVMEPDKVVPYFGTLDKPECHMLYNVTTMASTWNSVATRDIRLLKMQMDIVNSLPKVYTFLNYLRCHDDIGWGLDYGYLKQWGMNEIEHKRYLNDYFRGFTYGSQSRGELYNDDPVTMDARFCGTTASMCGVEAGAFEGDQDKIRAGIRMDLMLHAYMLTQSGIPMLYSGDEIAQLNDYGYKHVPSKWHDSRYLHRGQMDWESADRRLDKYSVEYEIFNGLKKMEQIRKTETTFSNKADVYTYDVHNNSILGITRKYNGDTFIGLFNFSEWDQTAWMYEQDEWTNLMTDEVITLNNPLIKGHDFVWCKLTKAVEMKKEA